MEGEVCRQSAAIRSEWVWEERAALTGYLPTQLWLSALEDLIFYRSLIDHPIVINLLSEYGNILSVSHIS